MCGYQREESTCSPTQINNPFSTVVGYYIKSTKSAANYYIKNRTTYTSNGMTTYVNSNITSTTTPAENEYNMKGTYSSSKKIFHIEEYFPYINTNNSSSNSWSTINAWLGFTSSSQSFGGSGHSYRRPSYDVVIPASIRDNIDSNYKTKIKNFVNSQFKNVTTYKTSCPPVKDVLYNTRLSLSPILFPRGFYNSSITSASIDDYTFAQYLNQQHPGSYCYQGDSNILIISQEENSTYKGFYVYHQQPWAAVDLRFFILGGTGTYTENRFLFQMKSSSNGGRGRIQNCLQSRYNFNSYDNEFILSDSSFATDAKRAQFQYYWISYLVKEQKDITDATQARNIFTLAYDKNVSTSDITNSTYTLSSVKTQNYFFPSGTAVPPASSYSLRFSTPCTFYFTPTSYASFSTVYGNYNTIYFGNSIYCKTTNGIDWRYKTTTYTFTQNPATVVFSKLYFASTGESPVVTRFLINGIKQHMTKK